MRKIKIAVLIPDRCDRPEFMHNCLQMMKSQTLQPVYIHIENYKPESAHPDITQRYRRGYEYLSAMFNDKINLGEIDLIAFIENDDYYAPNYLETMAQMWEENGCSDMIGTTYSHYYHLSMLKYSKLEHFTRSAAMNTFIKPNLNISWCADSQPYTDMHLWTNLKGVSKTLVAPENIISIGMKHGIGKCGGAHHTNRLDRYRESDEDRHWLKSNTLDSFDFYYAMSLDLRARESMLIQH